MTKKQPDQIDAASRDGAFIHGLTLEGCRWDDKVCVFVRVCVSAYAPVHYVHVSTVPRSLQMNTVSAFSSSEIPKCSAVRMSWSWSSFYRPQYPHLPLLFFPCYTRRSPPPFPDPLLPVSPLPPSIPSISSPHFPPFVLQSYSTLLQYSTLLSLHLPLLVSLSTPRAPLLLPYQPFSLLTCPLTLLVHLSTSSHRPASWRTPSQRSSSAQCPSSSSRP